MDDEGCIASLKSIRDQIAQELGVDDGDKTQIRFTYSQATTSRAAGQRAFTWYVSVDVVHAPTQNTSNGVPIRCHLLDIV
jgi:hypothetical protein